MIYEQHCLSRLASLAYEHCDQVSLCKHDLLYKQFHQHSVSPLECCFCVAKLVAGTGNGLACVLKASVPSQQTMTAWVSALQAHALQAPGTCGPLIEAALDASLELHTAHAAVVLEGLAGIASKAGELLLHSRSIVGPVKYP